MNAMVPDKSRATTQIGYEDAFRIFYLVQIDHILEKFDTKHNGWWTVTLNFRLGDRFQPIANYECLDTGGGFVSKYFENLQERMHKHFWQRRNFLERVNVWNLLILLNAGWICESFEVQESGLVNFVNETCFRFQGPLSSDSKLMIVVVTNFRWWNPGHYSDEQIWYAIKTDSVRLHSLPYSPASSSHDVDC